MKKTLVLPVAADLVDCAEAAQDKIDSVSAGIENKKAELKKRENERKAAAEAEKAKEQAEREAKKAEAAKALKDTLNDLSNLKDALTR